jgi:hypothetical protein
LRRKDPDEGKRFGIFFFFSKLTSNGDDASEISVGRIPREPWRNAQAGAANQ